MSPLISVKQEIAKLRDYISTLEEGSYPHEIATRQLVSLNKRFSHISSQIPPTKPPLPSLYPVPIKCGIRTISATPEMAKEEPWCWDNLTEKQTKKLEGIQNVIRENFFTTVENHILKLIVHSGGLKAAMEKHNSSHLFHVPDFVRKEHGPALFKTFTDALLK